MTTTIDTTAVHSTFRLERAYKASPARVFRAFAETEAKRRWFVEGEGWEIFEYSADFRTGGREYSRFSFQGGPAIENETVYLDIQPDARLVFAYRMATPAGPDARRKIERASIPRLPCKPWAAGQPDVPFIQAIASFAMSTGTV